MLGVGLGVGRGALAEIEVLLDPVLVEEAETHQFVGDAVGHREVRVGGEEVDLVGLFAGTCAPRGQVDEVDLLALETAVHDPREEHRMLLGGIVAPTDQHGAVVEIVMAAGRFVHAIGGVVAGGRAGHAQPGVGVDVIRAEPRLHEFVGHIAFTDGVLARAVKRKFLGVLGDLGGNQRDRVIPRDRLVGAVALPLERLGQTILAVHDQAHMVALHAAQTLIHIGLFVGLHGHDFAFLHAQQDAAAGPAETARSLVPDHAIGGGIKRRRFNAGNGRIEHRSGRSHG